MTASQCTAGAVLAPVIRESAERAEGGGWAQPGRGGAGRVRRGGSGLGG